MVLFFDDFERSKLDRIELMGVINEYSENRKVKVIIIADEEKIARKKLMKITLNPTVKMIMLMIMIQASLTMKTILTILNLKKS